MSGKQGFPSMDPAKRREIASLGGKSFDPAKHKGNFANRPREDAINAGRKGGKLSAQKRWGKKHEAQA